MGSEGCEEGREERVRGRADVCDEGKFGGEVGDAAWCVVLEFCVVAVHLGKPDFVRKERARCLGFKKIENLQLD